MATRLDVQCQHYNTQLYFFTSFPWVAGWQELSQKLHEADIWRTALSQSEANSPLPTHTLTWIHPK